MLQEKDKSEFAKLLQFLAIRFNKPNIFDVEKKKLTQEELKSYFFFLADEFCNIEEFANVCKKLGKTWSYGRMPEPNYFLEAKKTDEVDVEMIAQKSWEQVIEAIENGAGYTSIPNFEDKLVEYVVNIIGGFYTLRQLDYKQLEFKKKEYIKLYKQSYNKDNLSIPTITHKTSLENVRVMKIKAPYSTKKFQTDSMIENKQSEFNKKLGLSFKRI